MASTTVPTRSVVLPALLRRRGRIADLLGVAGGALIVLLQAFDGGGYFPVQYLAAGVAALVGSAVLLVVRGATWRPGIHGLVAAAGLVGLGAWTGISSRWSPLPDVAVTEMQRQISYAAILGFGLVAVGPGRRARLLVLAIGGALVTIALAGFAGRLLPGLGLTSAREEAFGVYRLSYPINYWNAQGAAAAMAAAFCLGLAGDRRSAPWLRGLAAGLVPLLAVTLLLTVSRGAIVAAVVGAAVVVALARRPLQTLLVSAVVAVPTAIAVAIAATTPAVIDDPSLTPGLDQAGPQVAVATVGLGALAGVGAVIALQLLLRREKRRRLRGPQLGRTQRIVALATVVLLVLGLGGTAVVAGRVDGEAAGQVSSFRRFLDEQRQEFLAAGPATGTGADRLSTASGTRSAGYRVAWHGFTADPLLGDGVGGFRVRWLRERTTGERIVNAHSLPLETLGELGLPGFALLLAFLGAVAAGAIRGRLRPTVLSRAQAAGATGAITAFLTSCLLDWTWQMGALTAAALLLAATLLPEGRRHRRSPGAPAA
ncbi:O-antigen ligase family protein [Patulibacter defluvii]|uniref:O-antigen ligase family protein n=1 Tax=Patulibacter defluvii TaxID=3095358 RepID=UPI002A74DD06|nr:O-antigen ligase family protein [Patulibacter sp. DM4]